MTTKAITETRPDRPRPWEGADTGPSPVRDDNLDLGRILGLVSIVLVVLGGLVLALAAAGRYSFIGIFSATAMFAVGLVGLVLHAAFDRDVTIRRIYMGVGFLCVAVGAVLCLVPYPIMMGGLFGQGFFLLTLGLLFTVAYLRNEEDAWFRRMSQIVLGVTGGLMALTGLGLGLWLAGGLRDFLLPIGLLLGILGLIYLVASVTVQGTSDDRSYYLGLGIGGFGALVFLVALLRSLLADPSRGASFQLFPYGLVLMTMGLVYVAASAGLCSESPVIVMTRRELGAFFFTPVAYFVLVGFTIANWLAFYWTVNDILVARAAMRPVLEPIVARFGMQIVNIFAVTFAVPALTMRLLSEEKRTGTMEVLMTVPVSETTVVVSKFLAVLIMYLVLWLPFAITLIGLRLIGGQPFDYRPLLSFAIAVVVTGAGFVSMGLFFSALTRNQIISGVLTFGAMLALLLAVVFHGQFEEQAATGDPLGTSKFFAGVLKHISYYELWMDALAGKLTPQLLLFPISMTIFFLFLSVKVLEARKWS